eukprot:880190-Pelagomonas_calceolata.AAC.1
MQPLVTLLETTIVETGHALEVSGHKSLGQFIVELSTDLLKQKKDILLCAGNVPGDALYVVYPCSTLHQGVLPVAKKHCKWVFTTPLFASFHLIGYPP